MLIVPKTNEAKKSQGVNSEPSMLRRNKPKPRNKERVKESNKIYRHKNREKIREQRKTYNEKNKEKKKERDKVYNEKNREKNKKRHQTWYINNRRKMLAKVRREQPTADRRWTELRRRVKKHGLENTLSRAVWEQLTCGRCFWCFSSMTAGFAVSTV